MAYVLWRVFMKKYSRVRLGIHKAPVTPTGRHIRSFEESSWKPIEDNHQTHEDKFEEFSRQSDERQSKSKRVKNYLKKCKNVLSGSNSGGGGGTSGSNSNKQSVERTNNTNEQNCAYWYVDNGDNDEHNDADEIFSDCEMFEKIGPNYIHHKDVNVSEETLVDNGAIDHEEFSECVNTVAEEDIGDSVEDEERLTDSLPTLVSEQAAVEELEPELENQPSNKVDNEGKGDVASLVDRLMGPLYPNYDRTRMVLVRQARDLLVCEYLGNLSRFEAEFCVPAAALLGRIKERLEKECKANTASPLGWPLSLGGAGIVVHLGPLAPELLRNRDCYLCVRGRSAPGLEVALVWRRAGIISCRTLAEFMDPIKNLDEITCLDMTTMDDIEMASFEDLDGQNLPELLQNLLVSVEHAIQRVPLDDLAYPCQQCHQYLPLNERPNETSEATVSCACQCSCVLPEAMAVVVKKDTCIQTSPMFEFAGAIPHIDSDEDDDKDLYKSSGSPRRSSEIITPKTIRDIPEKLLMSGINLPGTHDRLGRPIVLCDAPCVNRAGLNRYEVATLLLYYASIPSKERVEKGFTILVLAETAEEATLDILDNALLLIGTHVRISSVLVWRPGNKKGDSILLANTKIKSRAIHDESSLERFIERDQAPASCGGTCTHDQLEWVEFFRELEPFVEQCQTIGRSLLTALSEIREQEIPTQIVRRFLHHQQRQLNRALQEPGLQCLRRTGSLTLESLTERSQWLNSSEDVKRRSLYARHSYTVADKVANRLEQLAAERRAGLEQLAKLRALEDEAKKTLSWLRSEAEEGLQNHNNLQKKSTSLAEIKQQNQNFEPFYFNAMRQIDKVGDLVEEANHCQSPKARNFKDLTQTLKQEISVFNDKLEDIRQRLEDTSRCYDLLVRCCQSTAEESKTDVLSELTRMAAKSGNETLIEKCQALNETTSTEESCTPPRLAVTTEAVTSTPIRPAAGQHRRRSVSSFAFIYKCNHHAAGVSCDCWEADSEENTESAKLKKKYEQIMQVQSNCGCNNKNTVDRKNSLGLDNIKEVRESNENLLETSEKNDSGVSGCGRCDSGLSSTGNASSVCHGGVGDEAVYKKRLHRTCSCQYCNETGIACSGGSSSGGSHGDHTDHQQYNIEDVFPKSTGIEELEENDEQYNNERTKAIPPIAVNSHLHCRASNLDLPNIQDQSLDAKTQKTLLLIMREMIQTERDYVRSLQYVIENYIPELLREDIPQALRGQRNVVFGNIEKIYEFHSQQFLRELEKCENCPLHVGQIFLRHKNRFSLYALYNKNKPKSDSLMTEYGRTFFKSKQVQLNDNLDLASYLLKPVQRMGKYALLLQQLMKACPELPEGSSERAVAERDDLKAAEEMVKFQLRHGNDLLAMDSIRECDVNLKEQGRLLRQNEFLVSEGRGGKKSLRQVFLFEELILFSKARRFPDRKNLDLYIYKNSIKMTDIGLTAKIGDSPTKFEIWFRKRKPNDTFILQPTSEEMKKLWIEELSKLLWRQAMKNREVRLQEMSSMGIGNKPCLDIRPSADNINDRSISIAQLTKTAPKFRNSIVGPVTELCRNSNRPHSIISVSSISSGSTSSQGSGGTLGRHMSTTGHLNNMVFDASESPRTHHRSHTLNSQCSMESGIIADISIGSDDCPEIQLNNSSSCWPLQKSNSQNSNNFTKSVTTNSAQTDAPTTQQHVTLIHVPDDVPINI